jgi:hypothetical protein
MLQRLFSSCPLQHDQDKCWQNQHKRSAQHPPADFPAAGAALAGPFFSMLLQLLLLLPLRHTDYAAAAAAAAAHLAILDPDGLVVVELNHAANLTEGHQLTILQDTHQLQVHTGRHTTQYSSNRYKLSKSLAACKG